MTMITFSQEKKLSPVTDSLLNALRGLDKVRLDSFCACEQKARKGNSLYPRNEGAIIIIMLTIRSIIIIVVIIIIIIINISITIKHYRDLLIDDLGD